MPPANILASLPQDQQKSLAIFSCQAFQRGGDWQEITFKLPGQTLPQVFKRGDLEGLVVEQTKNLAQKLPTTQQTELLAKVADIKTNAAGIGQQLLETEVVTQPGSSSARLLQRYQQQLANLTDQIGIQPITFVGIENVKQAVVANENLQQNLKEVNQTIENNLQAKYSPYVKKDRVQAISGIVTQTIVGKLEENQDLTPQVAQETSQQVKQTLILDAAITNAPKFTSSLVNSFSSLQKKKASVIGDYNALRNFQISINATFWPVAEQLAGAGLDISQINKTIGYLEQNLDKISSNWELQHYLRQELGKYPQLGRKVDSLASQISLGLQVQKANARLTQPVAQTRLEALATHVYCSQGTTAEELRQAGLHGLADRVEQLAKDPKLQKLHQKTFAQQQKQKQKWAKIFAQRQKEANKRQFLATHSRGWVLAPRMRLSMALDKSAGWRKFKNFAPKVTPGYWANQGNRVIRKQIGNWLINQGLDKAGQTFLTAGFRGLFKHALGKVGLGSLLGPVGTAAALGLAILANKDLRDLVGSLLGGAGFIIYYLLVKLPLTLAFAAFGFATFGPMGLALGGIGFALDQAIGGLGGIGKAAGAALPKAAAGLETAASIPTQASLVPATANVGAGVSVLGAIGIPFIGSLLAFITFYSAASLPPGKEGGGGISGPENITINPDCQHPACKITQLLSSAACGSGIVNQTTWNKVKSCLENAGIEPQVIEEMRHSVFDLAGNTNLQCVGFKIAVEKAVGINLPRQNAVAFYQPGAGVSSPRVGDNAVWGPRDECPTQDPVQANQLCQSNMYCCGHIGVVTKVESDGSIKITSAWGDSGSVNTIVFPPGAEKEDGAPWQYLRR